MFNTSLLSNFAEIAILATAYYFLLSSVRGTRGAGILKGLFFFAVVAFVGTILFARVLGFLQIKAILESLLQMASIAAIVIFAPEMRRGLLRLAQSRILSPLIQGPSLKVVDHIVNAAVRLSKNRIGALIAVERDVGLGDYIEKGVRIDAAVSSELIETLFYPGNALHDGAIILQHDRIAAAACFFPLSEEENLSKSMGTRHRAALGVTEESDAIVVIVSEETGRISIATKNKITSDLSREALDKALRDLLTRGDRGLMPRFRRPRAAETLPASPPLPAPPVPEPQKEQAR